MKTPPGGPGGGREECYCVAKSKLTRLPWQDLPPKTSHQAQTLARPPDSTPAPAARQRSLITWRLISASVGAIPGAICKFQ
jgi:hypothetical protein